MKSNLLYRGQEASYSYVWLEFRRAAPAQPAAADPLPDEYVTVGVGMRAHRHTDGVKRWYFVAGGRVGVDLSLFGPDDRPLTRKELAAEVGADAVCDTSAEHRAAVDARLFGLGRERFEQLLNLVLTLRRPQLAKNLDPVKLSETLTEGLRPLDEDLVGEASRSFDDMEAVQRSLDGLVAADEAAKAFLSVYATYLRTHARAAADALTARRGVVSGERQRLTSARAAQVAAAAGLVGAGQELGAAERALGTARAHLDSLRASEAYRSREQLLKLAELVAQLADAARAAAAEAGRRRAEAAARERDLIAAVAALGEQEAEASRAAAGLAADAADAGIAWGHLDASEEVSTIGSRPGSSPVVATFRRYARPPRGWQRRYATTPGQPRSWRPPRSWRRRRSGSSGMPPLWPKRRARSCGRG